MEKFQVTEYLLEYSYNPMIQPKEFEASAAETGDYAYSTCLDTTVNVL